MYLLNTIREVKAYNVQFSVEEYTIVQIALRQYLNEPKQRLPENIETATKIIDDMERFHKGI